MARTWIVVGDKTTHGGTVVVGSPFSDIDGKPIARINDAVACPKCGPTVIVGGDSTTIIDGQAVARHGDATSCGATLISTQQLHVFIDTGTAVGAGAEAGSEQDHIAGLMKTKAAAITKKPFDEQFRAVDAISGKPIAGLPYRIVMQDGTTLTGVTDANGMTLRVASDVAEQIQLHWDLVIIDDDQDESETGIQEGC